MAIAPQPGAPAVEHATGPQETYADLLHLPALLAAASSDPDPAMRLFLIVHQSCELMFKEIVDRAGDARDALTAHDAAYAAEMARPLPALVRVLSVQFEVLLSLTRPQFEKIRSRAGTASGIQSAQWRRAEYICGLRDARHVNTEGFSAAERRALQRELDRPSLASEFQAYARDPRMRRSPERTEQTERLRRGLVAFDDAVTRWRAGHIEIARHFLAGRDGTAGTTGERYLADAATRCLIPGLHQHPEFAPHHLQGAT
ncbi:tryptophan 2,3-dioxygenase family protein [Streptomyces niveus]|uniref:tryptophan 2,3-dioxygenase family protein n=1 Tax=Streptomyces niveus TaxID=193462 RepID=UPI003680D29B